MALSQKEQPQNFRSTFAANRRMFSLRSRRSRVRVGQERNSSPLPRCPRDPAMRPYLITYDTAAPSRHSVASAIMQLGDAWARPLDNTWYVQSTDRAAVLKSRLKTHLDSEDGLLIQQVEADAVLLN